MNLAILYFSSKPEWNFYRIKREIIKHNNIDLYFVRGYKFENYLNLIKRYKKIWFVFKKINIADFIKSTSFLKFLDVDVYNSMIKKGIYVNKITFYQYCIINNIPIPKTLIFFKNNYNKDEIKRIILDEFDFPFILKFSNKHMGKGVYLINSEKELNKLLETKGYFNIIAQEFINYDYDLRAMFVGYNLLKIMRRIPLRGFKANISQGNVGEIFNDKEIEEKVKKYGEKICKDLGIEFCGLDVLLKNKKLYFIEANTNPTIKEFERVTKINVLKKFFDYILK